MACAIRTVTCALGTRPPGKADTMAAVRRGQCLRNFSRAASNITGTMKTISPARGADTCACRKLNPGISVMQPAQDWATKNVPGAIDGARDRCILIQG
jgi:hypothetical protein